MIAIDTNVVVRFVTGDETDSLRAKFLVASHQVYVSLTVCLETEWVLRSKYRYDWSSIEIALRTFVGQLNVIVEAPARLAQAMAYATSGMDFADALHLEALGPDVPFATLDRRLRNVAAALGFGQVREP